MKQRLPADEVLDWQFRIKQKSGEMLSIALYRQRHHVSKVIESRGQRSLNHM